MRMCPHTSKIKAYSKCSNYAIIISLYPVSLVGDGCSQNGLGYCYLDVSAKLDSINEIGVLSEKPALGVAYQSISKAPSK